MANRERGELRLVARQRSYTLRLTVGACCELEDRIGRMLATVLEGLNQGRADDVRWLAWAALQAKHGDQVQTPDDAGRVLTLAGGLSRVIPILAEFMALNANDEQADETRRAEATDDRPGSQWRRLYLDARVAGIEPETFWSLSIRELWLELAAAHQTQKQAHEREIGLAWWVASLSRQERLPALRTLLGRTDAPSAKQTQTWQEMKSRLKALTGGGTERT